MLQMKTILITILLTAGISCMSDKVIDQTNILTSETSEPLMGMLPSVNVKPVITSEPYEINLELKKIKTDLYDFEISMKLNNNSHFVSPNAERDFSGKFTILMNETNKLVAIEDLIETPRSVEEYDPHPFTDGLVNWVRVDTKYNQKLQQKSQDNFEVSGIIQFTIEPRCTLEKIPFTITHLEGKMTVSINRC